MRRYWRSAFLFCFKDAFMVIKYYICAAQKAGMLNIGSLSTVSKSGNMSQHSILICSDPLPAVHILTRQTPGSDLVISFIYLKSL